MDTSAATAFGKGLKNVIEVFEELERIGSIENHAMELTNQRDSLKALVQDALNELAGVEAKIVTAKEDHANHIQVAADIIRQAQANAQSIVSQARTDAQRTVDNATIAMNEAKAKSDTDQRNAEVLLVQTQCQVQDVQVSLNSLKAELSALKDRIS